MGKYRKKPVVIEAFRFQIDNEMPDWFADRVTNNTIIIHEDGTCDVKTLEGTMKSSKGDYIILGVNGEVYPCKPDIFKKTYEPVEEPLRLDFAFILNDELGGRKMNFEEYQQLAERTANVSHKGLRDKECRLINFGLGISGEAGEVTDCIKKVVFHNHNLDIEYLKKELGDVLWYVATLATTLDLSLEKIAITNIEKLKKRYPDGFSEEKSINRTE